MKFGMRVRGGLIATLIIFVPLLTTLAAVLTPAPAFAQTVNTIEVVGNRRVEIETIRIEGVARGPEHVAKTLEQARQKANALN